MAKELTEDELNLRRRARRRLIGAFALTLAVVVMLPMVLDSEPKPSGKDIDLRIPSPDKVSEFVPGAAVSEAPGTPPPAVPAVVTPIPLASPVITAPAQEPDAKKPLAAPVQQAVPKVSSPKPAETKSAVEEGYIAQVGAYSNPNTAKQELKKLKKWGFKAYTEKSGDKIRVRVGPYADRDKAEKVRELLEKHGLHPVIISAK
jgi:DedD protein